VGLILLTG
jgi:hypothetical protein